MKLLTIVLLTLSSFSGRYNSQPTPSLAHFKVIHDSKHCSSPTVTNISVYQDYVYLNWYCQLNQAATTTTYVSARVYWVSSTRGMVSTTLFFTFNSGDSYATAQSLVAANEVLLSLDHYTILFIGS